MAFSTSTPLVYIELFLKLFSVADVTSLLFITELNWNCKVCRPSGDMCVRPTDCCPFAIKIGTLVTHAVGSVHTNFRFSVFEWKASTERTDGRTDRRARPVERGLLAHSGITATVQRHFSAVEFSVAICPSVGAIFATNIWQGSVATPLRCGGTCNYRRPILQVSCWVYQWNNCEHRSISGEDMPKSLAPCFLA